MNSTLDLKPEEPLFRVIVAGSRGFDDWELMEQKLDWLLSTKSNVQIVSGGARGADRCGEAYARRRGHGLQIFPADWSKYGKPAGYIRNEMMASYADALVAFWDGESRGTKHMIDLATKFDLAVRVVRYTPLVSSMFLREQAS